MEKCSPSPTCRERVWQTVRSPNSGDRDEELKMKYARAKMKMTKSMKFALNSKQNSL